MLVDCFPISTCWFSFLYFFVFLLFLFKFNRNAPISHNIKTTCIKLCMPHCASKIVYDPSGHGHLTLRCVPWFLVLGCRLQTGIALRSREVEGQVNAWGSLSCSLILLCGWSKYHLHECQGFPASHCNEVNNFFFFNQLSVFLMSWLICVQAY